VKLELRGVTKRFGSLTANDHVDLVVESGEIHALLGENGAGKTTLMNVLYGLTQPDEGEIVLDDRVVRFASPADALHAHIGMVHQHFMLVPVFTVAENVVLGMEPVRLGGFLDRRKARADISRLSASFGLPVEPDALVEDLPVGVQQRVEIIKALVRGAQLLILDEPTSVLTPQESAELFTVMRSLRANGHSVLFITHKLGEVLEVADQITVMRQGRVVGTTTPPQTSESALAAMMVGRDVEFRVPKAPAAPGEVALSVSGLTVLDELGSLAVNDLSFEVRSGEILALAGVQGNGQTELVRTLVGLLEPVSGRIEVQGVDVTRHAPHEVAAAGVGYIPEDRQLEGLVLSFPVAENLVLDIHDRPPFSKGLLRFDPKAVLANGRERIAEFDIRPPSPTVAASALSGGNQQKVVIARELSRPLTLLIASQPTRGLDVGSIETVHRRIVEERDKGTAVLLVSTELDEVLALGDRIAVMYRGAITGYVSPDAPIEEIGLMLAGRPAEGAQAAAPAGPAAVPEGDA
jgi:simple sugar transport system ATP-binding protein